VDPAAAALPDAGVAPVGAVLYCCAVLCCAALRCAALRCAALRCAALCCAVLCCAVPCTGTEPRYSWHYCSVLTGRGRMLTRLSISSDSSRAAHGCSRTHAWASQYIWPCKPPCRPNLMAAPLCALLRLRRLGICLRFLGLCLCPLCLCPGLCCLRVLCITSLPLSVLLLLFLLANRLAHTSLHSSDTCDHTRSCQHACIRTPCVHTCINISSTKKRFWGKRCSALRAAADADQRVSR
jgi:hypothetical protein